MKRRTFTLAASVLAGVAAVGRRARAQAAAWTALFNGRDLEGWDRIGDANWRVEDGAIVADRGSGHLVSRATFGDFQLRAEFWADTATNSGIFIRATNPATVSAGNAYEVNIWDERPEQRYGTGAIVDVAAVDPMPRAGGRWNSFDITARGDTLTVILNGQTTVNGVRNSRHASGRITLQHAPGIPNAAGVPNDRGVIRFRKVEIRTL